MADRRAPGRAGEAAAARALEREGWTLLDRCARTPAGELDLVLERRGVLAFVEVKARRAGARRPADDAVDVRKARRVFAASDAWLRRHRMDGAPREFLAAAVDLDDEGRAGAVRIVPLEA